MGEPGWYPDHTAERRADFAHTTAADRILEALELTEVVTRLAAAGREKTGREAAEGDALLPKAVLRTLVESDVDFVVIGDIAVAAHGYPRATNVVEIVAATGSSGQKRLLDALPSLSARLVEPAEPAHETLRTHLGRVNLQWRSEIEFERLRDRAIHVELPDVGAVLVAGYDELVAMKRAAGRPADQADLAELERVRDPDP
jgi:hypothetical protein